MKKAMKIIGFCVGTIAIWALGGLSGYEMAWAELFERKHYGAAHMLEAAARDTWRAPFAWVFHCCTSYVRNKNRS